MKNKLSLKYIFILLFAMVTLTTFAQEDFRKTAPKSGPAPKIELGKAYQTTLVNGLKVIAVENHKLPRVSFQIYVDAPPLNEGDKAGAARISGELLARGTTTRSKAEIDEAVDYIGGSLSSSASGIRGTCLSSHKETILELMSDILLNPAFPVAEFDKVKKKTLSAIASEKDDANAILGKVSNVMRYGKEHPYGEIETDETIEKITLDDVKKYYVQHFKPNISYLIVVGDITPKEVDAIANKYFLKWAKGEVPLNALAPVKIPNSLSVDFVDKPGAVQSAIAVTYPVNLAPGAPDAIKASVANTMLGGFFGSRLSENIREDKGYSYGVRSTLRPDPVIGYFSAGGSVRNEVTDSTLTEFIKEMKRMRKELISDEDLSKVKSVMTGTFARRLENPEIVALYALNIARYNLPSDYYSTYLEKLAAVTKADVMEMANKYMRHEIAHVVIVGNKEEVADKVAIFAKGEQANFYDNFGNPVSDSGKAIPDGVTAQIIIEDYLQGIGGVAVLEKVNSLQSVMNATVQGMTMQTKMYQKSPTMSVMEVAMNGQVMQKMVYDGEKGFMEAMGQKKDMPQSSLDRYSVGYIFPELHYKQIKARLDLAGLETINEEDAYKINTEFANGQKSTDYYSQQSGLKIRTITTDQGQTQIMDYGDYKEVDGIMIPHKVTISGAMPFALNMNMESVKVNGDLDGGMFKVD